MLVSATNAGVKGLLQISSIKLGFNLFARPVGHRKLIQYYITDDYSCLFPAALLELALSFPTNSFPSFFFLLLSVNSAVTWSLHHIVGIYRQQPILEPECYSVNVIARSMFHMHKGRGVQTETAKASV